MTHAPPRLGRPAHHPASPALPDSGGASASGRPTRSACGGPEAPAFGRPCGSAGIDGQGHCRRCGIFRDGHHADGPEPCRPEHIAMRRAGRPAHHAVWPPPGAFPGYEDGLDEAGNPVLLVPDPEEAEPATEVAVPVPVARPLTPAGLRAITPAGPGPALGAYVVHPTRRTRDPFAPVRSGRWRHSVQMGIGHAVRVLRVVHLTPFRAPQDSTVA